MITECGTSYDDLLHVSQNSVDGSRFINLRIYSEAELAKGMTLIATLHDVLKIQYESVVCDSSNGLDSWWA